MHMADWVKKLESFLQFNDRKILTSAGRISQELAEARALAELEKFEADRRELNATQPSSDFDRFVEETKKLSGKTRKELPKSGRPAGKTKRQKK
jgi:hypothetical protein